VVHTMTLDDRFDPPTFASKGADRWTRRNVERNGADAWASLTNIEVDVFLGRSPGFIVCSEGSHFKLALIASDRQFPDNLGRQLECSM
jgi:hypothetical protein